MGRRAKRKLHNELHEFSHVWEYDRVAVAPALQALAQSYQNIILEVGCGKGEYTLGLAATTPKNLYIGLDYQGERLWRGALNATEHKLTNVRFIRGWADHLLQYVPAHSITEIWLTFPDPFPKDKQENRRLISPRFLSIYRQVLKPGGVLHLKTDAQELHAYAKHILQAENWDVLLATTDIDAHTGALPTAAVQVHTYYEDLHRAKGEPITYLQAKLA